MKKKFAALLAAASILTAVPALAATPDAAPNGWGPQQRQTLSDRDNNDGWYCGRGYCGRGHGYCGRGHGYGRGGYCWDDQQQ